MKQEEIQKLSDRELLVKTFGDVEHIKGVLGNGGGILGDVRDLKESQQSFVTHKELLRIIAILSLVFAGFGALIYFL